VKVILCSVYIYMDDNSREFSNRVNLESQSIGPQRVELQKTVLLLEMHHEHECLGLQGIQASPQLMINVLPCGSDPLSTEQLATVLVSLYDTSGYWALHCQH
jgi:hypothetical protein